MTTSNPPTPHPHATAPTSSLPNSLPPNLNNNDTPGLPFYEKSRAHLRDLVRKQQQLQRTLAHQEESIYKKETDYLEDTPSGNIILGFENYTKGGNALGGGGRRAGAGGRGGLGVNEGNRVFSRSSVSWGVVESPVETAQSTPGNSAPTPVSATFLKGEGGGGASTPTSATAGKAAGGKKNKKGPGNGGGEDSETDGKEGGGGGGNKKARTAFGAVRK